MSNDREPKAIELRERRVDEALKESFPASDSPSFVGAGAVNSPDKPIAKNWRNKNRRNRSAEMASEVIDQSADPSASSDERKSRKRRLLKGPKEFRDFRRDRPGQKS
jgi:hypothetical protein